MDEGIRRKQLRTFPGLQAEDFQHEDDMSATAALRAVPGMDTLVSKVMEYGFERVYYLENMASNVRVTPRCSSACTAAWAGAAKSWASTSRSSTSR